MSDGARRRVGFLEGLLGLDEPEESEESDELEVTQERPHERAGRPDLVVEESQQTERPAPPTRPSTRPSATEAPAPSERDREPAPPSVPAADELEAMLDDPDTEQRSAALRRLLERDAHPEELALVARRLADPAVAVRRLAVQILERSEAAPDLDVLEPARFDPEPAVRSRVVHLLGRTGDPAAVAWLAHAIHHDDDRDVAGAAIMAVPGLLAMLDDRALRPEQVRPLLEAVGSAREERGRFARELRETAYRLGHERISSALDDATGWVRVGAAVLALASDDPRLVEQLAALADQTDPLLGDLARDARGRPDDAERGGASVTPPADEERVETGVEHTGRNDVSHDAVSALIRALDDPDPEVGRSSEEALNQISAERVLDWLTEALRSGRDEDLERMANVAARTDTRAAVPMLAERALELPAGSSRTAVISALRDLDGTTELLETWGADTDPSRRGDAVCLATLLDPFSTSEAVSALDDHSPQVRTAALDALPERLDDELAERVLRVVETDASADVRAGAVAAFAGASGELRVEAARRGLDDTDPRVRRAAVEALDPGTHGELLLLVRSLTDEPDVARDAASKLAATDSGEHLVTLWGAIASAGEVSDAVLEVLLGFEQDTLLRIVRQAFGSVQPGERALAAAVLRRIPGVDVTELTGGLTDPAPRVRAEVLRACIDHPDAQTLEHVAGRLRDPEGSIRLLAIRALAQIDDDWTLPHLLEGCRDPLDSVRDEARGAVEARRSPAVVRLLIDHLDAPDLGRVATDLLEAMAPDVLDLLLGAIDGARPEQRRALGDVLARAERIEAVLERLDDVDPQRRRRAVQALSAARETARHTERLFDRLSDPDPSVRVTVAEALGETGDPAAVEPLKRAFVTDPDMTVVTAVERALRRLTGGGQPSADRDDDSDERDDDSDERGDGPEAGDG